MDEIQINMREIQKPLINIHTFVKFEDFFLFKNLTIVLTANIYYLFNYLFNLY